MGFNWKAFAGSYLEELAEGIDERQEEAKEYKEEQEELAARNLQVVQKRDARAKEAARIGRNAMDLGASKAQVIQAMSSGMAGVTQLYEKLQQLHTQQKLLPGQQLDPEIVEMSIGLPSAASVDPTLIAMDLGKLAQRTYGAERADKPNEGTKEPTFVEDLFGFGAKDRVKEKLGSKKYYGDMTISDINYLAQQGEYNALIPEVTMNFADLDQYDAKAKYTFATDLIEVQVNAAKAQEDNLEMFGNAAYGGSPEKKAREKKRIEMAAALNHIRYNAGQYFATGFFDDPVTKERIIAAATVPTSMGGTPESGEEWYNELMYEYFPERRPKEEDKEKPTVDEAAGIVSEELKKIKDEEKKTLSPTEKEAVSTKARIEENVYYQIEDEEGETKVIKGVPPRPTREFSNLFFGAGLGGETMQEILDGKIPVPKYLRPSQWDELFGDTHNPDGSPKQIKGE